MRIPILFTLLMKFHFRLLFLEVAMQKSSLARHFSFRSTYSQNHLFNTQKVAWRWEKKGTKTIIGWNWASAVQSISSRKWTSLSTISYYIQNLYSPSSYCTRIASIDLNVLRNCVSSLTELLNFVPIKKYLQTSLILKKEISKQWISV